MALEAHHKVSYFARGGRGGEERERERERESGRERERERELELVERRTSKVLALKGSSSTSPLVML